MKTRKSLALAAMVGSAFFLALATTSGPHIALLLLLATGIIGGGALTATNLAFVLLITFFCLQGEGLDPLPCIF